MRKILLVLAIVTAAGAVRADEHAPRDRVTVELLTFGVSDVVFERFGHAALCVHDRESPEGRCYNYGTGDFHHPETLIWNFIRGRARFWVAAEPEDAMLEFYQGEDRTIYRQTLDLPPDQVQRLADKLATDALPANRYFFYHHYRENCTTKLRDDIDEATGGALRAGTDRPYGPTFRELSLHGFATSTPLLIGVDLLLGSPADHHPTVWEAMFLPDVLRDEVAARFGATPVIVYQREHPLAVGHAGAGRAVLLALALGLAALIVLGIVVPHAFVRRFGLLVVGLVLGLAGVVLAGLAAVSTFPELRQNELVWVFWPTDLALVFLWGKALRGYLVVRLAATLVVALLAVVGVLVQPLAVPLALVALPLGATLLRERRAARIAVGAEAAEQALLSSVEA